jgi:hypothetical protein
MILLLLVLVLLVLLYGAWQWNAQQQPRLCSARCSLWFVLCARLRPLVGTPVVKLMGFKIVATMQRLRALPLSADGWVREGSKWETAGTRQMKAGRHHPAPSSVNSSSTPSTASFRNAHSLTAWPQQQAVRRQGRGSPAQATAGRRSVPGSLLQHAPAAAHAAAYSSWTTYAGVAAGSGAGRGGAAGQPPNRHGAPAAAAALLGGCRWMLVKPPANSLPSGLGGPSELAQRLRAADAGVVAEGERKGERKGERILLELLPAIAWRGDPQHPRHDIHPQSRCLTCHVKPSPQLVAATAAAAGAPGGAAWAAPG